MDQAGGRFGFVDPNVTAIVDGNEIIDLQLEAGESLRMIVTTAHEGLESIATKGPSSQIEKLERVYSGLRIIQQARKNTLEAESAGLTDEERTAVIVTLKEKLKGDPRAPHLEPLRAALAKLDASGAKVEQLSPKSSLQKSARTRGTRRRP